MHLGGEESWKNYKFSGKSLERAEALLYMRQVGGGGLCGLHPELPFFFEMCAYMAAVCEC